jgi:hypothetical protein
MKSVTRYFWVCPACKRSYGIPSDFVGTGINCQCGLKVTLQNNNPDVIKKKEEVELPANARCAREKDGVTDVEELELLDQALTYIKKYYELLPHNMKDPDFGLLICPDGTGCFVRSISQILDDDQSVFYFKDPLEMVNGLNRLYSEELKKQRGGAIAKLKEEINKYGLKASDLF